MDTANSFVLRMDTADGLVADTMVRVCFLLCWQAAVGEAVLLLVP